MIPAEAVEAAKATIWDLGLNSIEFEWRREIVAHAALEAAAPYMLAESDLMRWKLDALRKLADAMISESHYPQYGIDVRTLLEVASMDEAREIEGE